VQGTGLKEFGGGKKDISLKATEEGVLKRKQDNHLEGEDEKNL